MSGISPRMVELVLERDGEVCQLALNGCTYQATVADHRANRGMGGSPALNSPVNLIAACGVCNGAKEAVSGAEYDRLIAHGLRILRAATTARTLERAAATPVTYRHGDRYILRPDGGRTIVRNNGGLVQSR